MVYLLCFDKKFKHAKHYIGFAENQRTFEARMKHHAKGSGSRLMAAIAKAGIGFCVARTWPDGDRNFERKLKNRKKAAELCPHCTAALKEKKRREKVLAQEKVLITKMNKPPVIVKDDIVNGPIGLDPKVYDKPLVCPVIERASELGVPKIGLTPMMTVQEMIDKAKEMTDAQSKSDTNPSRWKRIWSCVARFLRLS